MKKYLIVVFMFLSISITYGEFGPWDADVDSGDALYSTRRMDRSSSKILNGAQGGAYFLVRFFQVVISPQDGPNCRHVPTCSNYGKHAVVKHGAFLGSFLAGERLLRCNPFNPPETDPVPDRVFEE